MHKNCSTLLLNYHEVQSHERPTEDDEKDGTIVFCTKTCYNKWFSHKKRVLKAIEKAAKEAAKTKRKVPWESDGSLDVLMDWITTEGNYANYCGANGNKGKSKTQYHKELSTLTQETTQSERSEKDVSNKIGSLERQFREASDWANNTGQGVEVTGEQFEDAVKKRCPLYYQLEDIMGDRPNAQPLATNEDELDMTTDLDNNNNYSFSDDDNNNDKDEQFPPNDGSDNDSDVSTDKGKGATAKTNAPSNAASASTAVETSLTMPANAKRRGSISSNASSTKRVSSTTARKRKTTSEADELLSDMFGSKEFSSFREREVQAREQEASARMIEAQATSAKANKETDTLGIDERVKCMDERVKLLRERKRLLDDKVCMEDELNKYLPLPE